MRYESQKFLQEPISQAYDIIVEKYGDEIDQLSSAIEEQLSDTAAEEAVAINEEFVAEFSCVSEVIYCLFPKVSKSTVTGRRLDTSCIPLGHELF